MKLPKFKPELTDVTITTRLSKKEHKKLVDYATDKDETISSVVRDAITKKLNAWK